jgi:quercetin dioxygenase-like cupin family protein
MRPITSARPGAVALGIALIAALLAAPAVSAQQPTPPPPISRVDLLKQVLPVGDYRNVTAAVVELAPGAAASIHRHDVGVLAYVIEGEIENQFNGGASQVHRAGESWWEAPGTVHNIARNPSRTAKTRFLVVYIGEEGKAPTVALPPAAP